MLVDTLSVATRRQRSIPSPTYLCEWQSSTVPLNCSLYNPRKNVWHLSDECILLFKWICVWNRCLSWGWAKINAFQWVICEIFPFRRRATWEEGDLFNKIFTANNKLVQHKASICNPNLGQKPLKMLVPNLVCLILTKISRRWRSVCTEVMGCNY